MRYELYSGHADNIRESIERGLLDIGLVAEPIDIRKYEFVSMPVKSAGARSCARIRRLRRGNISRRRI